MEACFIKNCKNDPRFYCSCKPNLFICMSHIPNHDGEGFHSMKPIYMKLDKNTQEKFIEILSTTIKNLEISKTNTENQAELIIKQIQQMLSSALSTIDKQLRYYEMLIGKCKNPRGINLAEYQLMWRNLDELGAKDLFKLTEFSNDYIVNPTLISIKETINELGQKMDQNFLENFLLKAKQDISYKEILGFLSKVRLKSFEVTKSNACKIIQLLKHPKYNHLKEIRQKRKTDEAEFEGFGVILDGVLEFQPNLTLTSQISNFLSSKFTQSVLETGRNLEAIKELLPDELALFIIDNNVVDFAKCIEFNFHLVNSELIKVLFDKYEFLPICNILKNFFLFGHGDFFYLIFEDLFRYNRSFDSESLLEECYWKSNASVITPEKYLGNLSMQFDDQFFALEWESYMLHYNLEYPVDIFISKDILGSFQQIFSLIWQVKRCEFILKQRAYKRALTNAWVTTELQLILSKMNMMRFEMVVFINHSLYFIMEEVIESSWKKFKFKILNALNLEHIDFALKEFVFFAKAHCFVEDNELTETFFKILKLVLRFVDLELEIEASALHCDENFYDDYQDTIEVFQELKAEYYTELKNLKELLTAPCYKKFHSYKLRLYELGRQHIFE